MEEYPCKPITSASKLSIHRDSHVIYKFKPKVRIVRIFAPEIIKTDVANFRELVQRLTGKPGDDQEICRKGSKTNNSMKIMKKTSESSNKAMQFQDDELSSLIHSGEKVLKMEEENEIWGSGDHDHDHIGENNLSDHDFLYGSDFNEFIQSNYCQMDVSGNHIYAP